MMLLLKAALGFMLAGLALANEDCETVRDHCFRHLRENPGNFKAICFEMLEGESKCLKTLEPICNQTAYTRAVYTFKANRYYCQPSVRQVLAKNALCRLFTNVKVAELRTKCNANYELSKDCRGLTTLRHCLVDIYNHMKCRGLCEVNDMFFYYERFPAASEWNCVWPNTSDRCTQ